MSQWTVSSKDVGKRLLVFLRDHYKAPTRHLRWCIEHQRCLINGKIERFCSTKLREGQRIQLNFEAPSLLVFEKKRLLFEHKDFIIYDKPAGFSSEEIAHHFKKKLVHRLDRDTTGCLILAHRETSYFKLLFKQRNIQKTYVAITDCYPLKDKGALKVNMSVRSRREGAVIWQVSEQGLYSETQWKVCAQEGWIRLFPKTGRTHQLRVHLAYLGAPIRGDVTYGGSHTAPRPLLHAESLSFTYHGERITCSAPIPFTTENISPFTKDRKSFIIPSDSNSGGSRC